MDSVQTNDTIVVIDDDRDFINIITMAMRHKDIHIVSATNAIDGIRLINKYRPKIVFLDVFLDNESGLKLCSDIKKISDAKVVMMSGYKPEKMDSLVELYGADKFISKPFAMDDMSQIISNELN